MGLFRKRQFELSDPAIRQMLQMATLDLNYAAVQGLYRTASNALGTAPDWQWWISLCEQAETRGDMALARMAVDFAYKANVEPWGDLSQADYDRLRPMRDRLLS